MKLQVFLNLVVSVTNFLSSWIPLNIIIAQSGKAAGSDGSKDHFNFTFLFLFRLDHYPGLTFKLVALLN